MLHADALIYSVDDRGAAGQTVGEEHNRDPNAHKVIRSRETALEVLLRKG